MRLWLLIQGEAGRDSTILTCEQMTAQGIHPLRCVYLGRFESAHDPAALATARQIATGTTPQSVIAHNVRIACDRRQTRRWRLSEQEIDLLIRGEMLRVRDRISR